MFSEENIDGGRSIELRPWLDFIHASTSPMWLRRDSRIVAANLAAAQLAGLSSEEELLLNPAALSSCFKSQPRTPAQFLIERDHRTSVEIRVVTWSPLPGITIFQAQPVDTPSALDADWIACGLAGQSSSDFSSTSELRRGLLSSTADCVEVLDLSGRLLYMNPGGRQIMQVEDPRSIQGLDWLSFWPGEHRAFAQQAFQTALAGGVGRFTGLCPKFTGQLRWWDVVVSPMLDSSGAIRRLLSISRDVTEMKEAQIRESVERAVLEATISTQPITGVLDQVCNLAELAIENRGFCSLFQTADSIEINLQCVSSPSIPGLIGATITGDGLTANSQQVDEFLRIASAVDLIRIPLNGPGGELVGMLVMWMKSPVTTISREQNLLKNCANLAAVAFARDAHLRRLRNKQDRLAAVSRFMPIGLYQFDASRRCIYANDRLSQMTGLTLSQCHGEGWLQSIHPEDRDQVRESWRSARESASEFHAEYRLVNPGPDGHERWVTTREAPTFAGGVIGTITDITDLKQALAAVAEGADRFRTLANNIAPFCWMADSTGWVFWYSDRWYDYTGTTLEQMQGWGWRAVHHPDHVDRVVSKISTHWISGETWEDTFPLRAKDGSYRWFLSTALPIRDQSGKIIRWFGTNIDVTELRQLQAALNRQNLALQRSNEELSRFAFVASHDLQEPLRMISSFAQLVQRSSADRLDPNSASHIQHIVDAAARMSRLIRDLLSYAQASAGNDEEPTIVSLDRIARAVVENLRTSIEECGATIQIIDLPRVCAVETRISQVLQNLLSNALKYRRPGVPPIVHITAIQERNHWRISVRDNGPGFDQEHATRIFDFLKRLHGREVPGTGLGLAICKTIIERSGGEIGAEGVPGQGSTFWFTLPTSGDE